jgi:predicted CxxxxCH...CXXCH cytochrome family protein
VGAHRNHLDPNPTWHKVVECGACHLVPATVADPGHIDGDNIAEVIFSELGQNAGATPEWDRTSCSGVYCHGATLSGGVLTTPTWTIVDGTQDACGNCHGFPPDAPHPEETDCGQCHPTVQPGALTFLDPGSHINGSVEVGDGTACDSCHGSDGIAAPPLDLAGNSERTEPGVGAHRQHIGPSDWHRQINCSNCHLVPTAVASPGHIDGDNQAELIFDALNPNASYDFGNATCSNVYCHGNARGDDGSMVFTDDPTLDCSSCHAVVGGAGGLAGRHQKHLERGQTCADCHASVANAALGIIGAELHINGIREVVFAEGGTWNPGNRRCSNIACHNTRRW